MNRTERLKRAGATDRTEREYVPVPSAREQNRQNHQSRRPPPEAHTPGGARELLAASIGEDPYERVEAMRQAGHRKARAEGVLYQLDHERKALLARLKSEYDRKHGGDCSEAKLDRLARADERYQQHLEGTAAATEEKELAWAEYYAIKSELEWDRAAVAHLNALSRLEEPT